MSWMRERTTTVVAAFVAGAVVATAATAGAAALITGSQIKDGSIGTRDLSPAIRRQLAARGSSLPGPRGPQGERGDPGQQGSQDSAAQVRDKLLTVDGPGSGLDADTLDGKHAADFAREAVFSSRASADPWIDPGYAPISGVGNFSPLAGPADMLSPPYYALATLLAKPLEDWTTPGNGLTLMLIDNHEGVIFNGCDDWGSGCFAENALDGPARVIPPNSHISILKLGGALEHPLPSGYQFQVVFRETDKR